jgi:excisionase family DNA binding protein
MSPLLPTPGAEPVRNASMRPADPLPLPGQLLLTVPQVARLLGMSAKAIYHRAERGQLPGVVRVGRSLRFRRAELVGSLSEGRGLSPKASR